MAGSSDETDSATFEATRSGSTNLSYRTSSGPLTESRIWLAGGARAGTWVDPQGASHAIAYHNMTTEPFWFFPVMIVQDALSGENNVVASYVGAGTFNGAAVHHLRLVAVPPGAASAPGLIEALSQTELYLDPGTLLPVGLTYRDHPDGTLTVDIPVEVLFSAYLAMNGVEVPTQIEQLRSNSVTLDLQVQSVAINAGVVLPASSTE